MRAVTRAVQDFLAARAKEQGLGTNEFIALIRIADGEGVTGAELVKAFGMRSSSITALADRLEQHGMIARRTHPSDRRVVILHATRRGHAVVRRALGPLLDQLQALAVGLEPRDFAVVLEFLNGIDRALADAARLPTTRRGRRPPSARP
jgi:DNA-binding MarR family transcriptional regulator